MKIRLSLVVAAALFVGLSCSRDPKVVARKYIESGNRYFEAGKYKEASLMYRNAVQKQPKSGEAHYRMGLTALKINDRAAAISAFRRAVEADSGLTGESLIDARLKREELELFLRPADRVEEAKKTAEAFLKEDPKSYAGYRLRANTQMADLLSRNRAGRIQPAEVKTMIASALADYRRALEIKPLDPEVTLAMIPILVSEKLGAEAAQRLEALIAKGGAQPLAYQSLAAVYLDEKRSADCERILQKGIADHLNEKVRAPDPTAYGLVVALAGLYRDANRREDMVKTLERLKSHGSSYPLAYSIAAGFYARMNEPDAALRQYDEGIKALPKQKLGYQKEKMFLLATLRKHTEAAALAGEILKENPRDPDARTLRASIQLGKEDAEKTMKELQEVVAQQPGNWLAHYSLGRAHLMRGDVENARKEFNQAINGPNGRSDHVGSRIGLAQTQTALGEFGAALDNANMVLKVDPANLPARLVRAAAQTGLGNVGAARTELAAILREQPNTPDAMVQMGLLARREQKLAESETWFQKAYAADPRNTRTLLALLDTMMAAKQSDRAIELVRGEIRKQPERTDLRETLGNLLMRAGQPDAALAEFKAAGDAVVAKNKASAARLYLKAGEIYRFKGDHAAAIKTGEMVRSLDSRNFQTLAFLALAYDGAGQRQEAAKIYEEAIKLDPNNVVMLNNYAYLLSQTGGNLDTALGYAQRAMQSRPEVDEIADTVGWIYMKKQLTDNAIEMFQKVVNKQPKNPMYRYHLAMALKQKGDLEEARKHAQIALQNNPPVGEVENMKRLLAK